MAASFNFVTVVHVPEPFTTRIHCAGDLRAMTSNIVGLRPPLRKSDDFRHRRDAELLIVPRVPEDPPAGFLRASIFNPRSGLEQDNSLRTLLTTRGHVLDGLTKAEIDIVQGSYETLPALRLAGSPDAILGMGRTRRVLEIKFTVANMDSLRMGYYLQLCPRLDFV